MRGLKLVAPGAEYMADYVTACREFAADGRVNSGKSHNYDADWQAWLLHNFKRDHLGLGLKPSFVPQSTFWLVRGDTYLGTGNIRHWLAPHLLLYGGHIGYSIRAAWRGQGLGTYLLGLLLPKARTFNIATALIMCDDSNIASSKIIEKNGGHLHSVINIELDGKPRTMRRYLAAT